MSTMNKHTDTTRPVDAPTDHAARYARHAAQAPTWADPWAAPRTTFGTAHDRVRDSAQHLRTEGTIMRYVTLTFAPDEYGMYPGAETVTMPVINLRHYFWRTRYAREPMSVQAARWALDQFDAEPVSVKVTEEA